MILKQYQDNFRSLKAKLLRRILGIKWQDHVRSETVKGISGVQYVAECLMRDQWQWLGHALRVQPNSIMKKAVGWEPERTGRIERPKPTWIGTVKREIGDS